MRVLIAVGRYNGDQRGGSYRIAWDCALELRSRGHDVVLLCEGVGTRSSEIVEGVRLLRYQTRPGWNAYRRHREAAITAMQTALGEWRPELVWGHSPFQFMAAVHSFRDAEASYVVHSPLPLEILASRGDADLMLRVKSSAGKRIERACIDRANRIQVLSKFTRECLRGLHGASFDEKALITPGWADTEMFRPAVDRRSIRGELGWSNGVHVLFTLRRLVLRMGLDRLVDAAALLKQRGKRFELYIAGEGELRVKLETQIVRLGLSDCVFLMGALENELLVKCYAACDAFVIPTSALECFGLIAVEAMAAGVPVLSTPVGALPEIIGEIEPRWLARDNSAEGIAVLLAEFLSGELPQHSPEELRSFIEAKYSHRTALQKFCDAGLATDQADAPRPSALLRSSSFSTVERSSDLSAENEKRSPP